jgi:hypothetical protein
MVPSADGDRLSRSQRHKAPEDFGDPVYKITLAEVEDFLARVADGNYQETGLRPRKLKQGPAQRKLFAERLLTERLRKWGGR